MGPPSCAIAPGATPAYRCTIAMLTTIDSASRTNIRGRSLSPLRIRRSVRSLSAGLSILTGTGSFAVIEASLPRDPPSSSEAKGSGLLAEHRYQADLDAGRAELSAPFYFFRLDWPPPRREPAHQFRSVQVCNCRR